MDQIDTLIAQKRAMLELARAKVAELERQIAVLSSVNVEDEFDQILSSKAKDQVQSLHPSETNLQTSRPSVSKTSEGQQTFPRTRNGRNPKGSVRTVLLAIFADGNEHELDAIEAELNARLPNPVGRGALRTALMNLKNEGKLFSRKRGFFQLARNGEASGQTEAS